MIVVKLWVINRYFLSKIVIFILPNCRNVAKSGCQTEFTYVPDIGIDICLTYSFILAHGLEMNWYKISSQNIILGNFKMEISISTILYHNIIKHS